MNESAVDKRAWDIVRYWGEAFKNELVFEGLDFSLLLRYRLSQVIGRGTRLKCDEPERIVDELKDIDDFDELFDPPEASSMSRFRYVVHPAYSGLMQSLKRAHNVISNIHFFADSESKRVYIPELSAPLASLVQHLCDTGYLILVENNAIDYENRRVINVDHSNIAIGNESKRFLNLFFKKLISSLSKERLSIGHRDISFIWDQCLLAMRSLHAFDIIYKKYRPDCFLLCKDSYPPFLSYALKAKQKDIPAITVQHGLDCEHYFLDDTHSSALLLWGEYRKNRYENDSENLPGRIFLTGNPEYDSRRFVKFEGVPSMGVWLWVTRPHRSSFCYSPSRKVNEGTAILQVLLDAVRINPGIRLLIKHHPNDYVENYRRLIFENGLDGRVCLVNEELVSLFEDAKIVICEDSTAGLEAMIAGKLVIHSHFCSSEPVMPFVDRGAALPGFNRQELLESLDRAMNLSDVEVGSIAEDQEKFVAYCVGRLDGQATTRAAQSIKDVLEERRI